MAKNIFATSWHTGGANAIAPVIRRLGEDGKVHLNVLGYDASEDVFRRAGVEYRRLGDYGLHDVSPHSARIMLLVHQPGLVLTGKSIQNKRENLRTVLEQSMAVAAKEIGIPTVAVTDFWTGNRECFSDVFTGELFAYLPDRVTAIDRHAKEDMLREGFPEERIVVTGNPHFDDLIDLREGFTEEDRRQVRRDLGLGENSYVIMFASQYIESHYGNSLGYTEKTVLRDIFEALQQIDKPQRGREVLVKAHPTRENEGELRAVCSGFGEGFVVVKKYDPRRAFMAS
ncbi:MAG: hypothetical protein HYW25_02945, partial [Candidatus Aenigmarchaeota archaeon]|nr:hypothetical protein [Candidatus Aenigmarchaeota archaeon]